MKVKASLPILSMLTEHLRGAKTVPCISMSLRVNDLELAAHGSLMETVISLLLFAIRTNLSLLTPAVYKSFNVLTYSSLSKH